MLSHAAMAATPTLRDQLERLFVLLHRARAFWRRGLVVFLVGVLAAVPYVFTRERQYRSETLILYHETIASDIAGNGEGGGDAKRTGARLRELLLSRTSLEPIIKDLGLYQDKIIHGEYIGAVEEMRKNISFIAGNGDTYQIAFVAKTPPLAQEVTRRLAECIVHEASKRRNDQATTLKEFLDTESTRNETALKQREADLAQFLVLHPEFVPKPGTAGANQIAPVANVPTGMGDPLLLALEIRASKLERQLNFDAGAPAPPPKPFKPPPDSAELQAARRDLADKEARFTEKHPDVVAARNRVKAAEDAQAKVNAAAAAEYAAQNVEVPPPPHLSPEVEEGMRKDLASLQTQIATRRAQLTSSSRTVDAGTTSKAIDPATTDPVALAVEFKRLSREVEDMRDQQQKLDQRLFRAQIAASSVQDDRNTQVSILDPPYLPVRPVSKSRTNLLAGLLALSLFLGIGLPIVSALLDDRIFDRRDIERLNQLPVIAVIPKPTSPMRQLPPAR
jgi:uncharacterized protein involved in exopolysaccharide biosynthesis